MSDRRSQQQPQQSPHTNSNNSNHHNRRSRDQLANSSAPFRQQHRRHSSLPQQHARQKQPLDLSTRADPEGDRWGGAKASAAGGGCLGACRSLRREVHEVKQHLQFLIAQFTAFSNNWIEWQQFQNTIQCNSSNNCVEHDQQPRPTSDEPIDDEEDEDYFDDDEDEAIHLGEELQSNQSSLSNLPHTNRNESLSAPPLATIQPNVASPVNGDTIVLTVGSNNSLLLPIQRNVEQNPTVTREGNSLKRHSSDIPHANNMPKAAIVSDSPLGLRQMSAMMNNRGDDQPSLLLNSLSSGTTAGSVPLGSPLMSPHHTGGGGVTSLLLQPPAVKRPRLLTKSEPCSPIDVPLGVALPTTTTSSSLAAAAAALNPLYVSNYLLWQANSQALLASLQRQHGSALAGAFRDPGHYHHTPAFMSSSAGLTSAALLSPTSTVGGGRGAELLASLPQHHQHHHRSIDHLTIPKQSGTDLAPLIASLSGRFPPSMMSAQKTTTAVINNQPSSTSGSSAALDGNVGMDLLQRKKNSPDDFVKEFVEKEDQLLNEMRFEIPVPEAKQCDPTFHPVSEQQILNSVKWSQLDWREAIIRLSKKLAEKRVFGPMLMARATVAGTNHSNYPNLPIQGILYIESVCRRVLFPTLGRREFAEYFRPAIKGLAARCRRIRHSLKNGDPNTTALASVTSPNHQGRKATSVQSQQPSTTSPT